MAERAEYHVMSHPQTFPRGLAPDYKAVGTTLSRRGKTLFAPQASLPPSRPAHKATAVFGHAGGRLVVPNTGELSAGLISRFTWLLKLLIKPGIHTKKIRSVTVLHYETAATYWDFEMVGLDRKSVV